MNCQATPHDIHAVKCELAGEALRRSGALRLRVTGWSMLPSVWPGDTLVFGPIDGDRVAEGDIVLFGRGSRLVAHRVVARSACDASILTRGDAVAQADAPLQDGDLLGKVSFIVRNGRCIEPSKAPRFSERAVSALIRRSEVAARVVVGVHGMRKKS